MDVLLQLLAGLLLVLNDGRCWLPQNRFIRDVLCTHDVVSTLSRSRHSIRVYAYIDPWVYAVRNHKIE